MQPVSIQGMLLIQAPVLTQTAMLMIALLYQLLHLERVVLKDPELQELWAKLYLVPMEL